MLAAAAAILLAPAAHAGQSSIPVPSLGDALSAFGQYTIPDAWSGVWDFQQNDYDCDTNDLLDTYSDTDTLGTGEVIVSGCPRSRAPDRRATRASTSTVAGKFEIDEGCSVTIGFSFSGSRNGDTANITTTVSQEFTPTLCAFIRGQLHAHGNRRDAQPHPRRQDA